MGLRPTKGDEDAVGNSVGRRKRLPHFRLPTGVFNGVGAFLAPAIPGHGVNAFPGRLRAVIRILQVLESADCPQARSASASISAGSLGRAKNRVELVLYLGLALIVILGDGDIQRQ